MRPQYLNLLLTKRHRTLWEIRPEYRSAQPPGVGMAGVSHPKSGRGVAAGAPLSLISTELVGRTGARYFRAGATSLAPTGDSQDAD
jgi:hypothetical protein